MEKDIILKVENLSKQYRLGLIGTGTISHDLNRWWAKVRGKEDPYLKIGETNDRESKGNTNYVWALKDISFEVERGEVLGIIGKNGAGKSTLLKILSRVTGPTIGNVKSRGRIASLLEVGTGFHPEMTGKENIYLNGAILGMTKKEITSKLEEIVAFSGCERYIDTPVKRYSSGMKVRLAFAVAAFLEPDILVIDEVLAVGDAEFQKKAVGKMQDIAKGNGRTVLFVSHNMIAVENLCDRAIILKNGQLFQQGDTKSMIDIYLENEVKSNRLYDAATSEKKAENENIVLEYASVENKSEQDVFKKINVSSDIDIRFKIKNRTHYDQLSLGFDLVSSKEIIVFGTGVKFECPNNASSEVICHIPKHFLNDEIYKINLYIHTDGMQKLFTHSEILSFEVGDIKREKGYLNKINGLIRPKLIWEHKEA